MPLTTIACLGLLVYMVFCGEYSVSQRMAYEHVIDSLRRELTINRDTMEYYRALNSRLTADPELMERVVRENYNMKRQGEDVFVITE